MFFLTFCPLSRKLKEKFLCELCDSSEAGGKSMRYYPVHLDIKNRNCLVVGGGSVGTRKVTTLLACGAKVAVVSPQANAELQKLAQTGSITLKERRYCAADLDDMFLVISATDDETLNRQISKNAENRSILCLNFELNLPPLVEDPKRFYRSGEPREAE